jgi:hypothetical protein
MDSRDSAKTASGRGHIHAEPRPEIPFSLSLKDNFDPPSGGGWTNRAPALFGFVHSGNAFYRAMLKIGGGTQQPGASSLSNEYLRK